LKDPQEISGDYWDERPAIPGLLVQAGYHCAIGDCNSEKESIGKSRDSVEKHQNRVHAVGRGKEKKREDWMIKSVQFQNLWDKTTYFRPFIVSDRGGSSEETTSRSTVDPTNHSGDEDQLSQLIQAKYASSQLEWEKALDELPTSGLHQTQIPQWIKHTGIANYLGNFGLSKSALWEKVRPSEKGTL